MLRIWLERQMPRLVAADYFCLVRLRFNLITSQAHTTLDKAAGGAAQRAVLS